jgi:hypothetical protein
MELSRLTVALSDRLYFDGPEECSEQTAVLVNTFISPEKLSGCA